MRKTYRTKYAVLKWIAVLAISLSLSACATSIESMIEKQIEVTITTYQNRQYTGFLVDQTDSHIRILANKEIKTYEMADVKNITYNNKLTNATLETKDYLTYQKLESISDDVKETKRMVGFLYAWTILGIIATTIVATMYRMSL
ncbi:hypothetical protein Ctha_1547 [Chloroherpeton thalassium ATCC 35110]|uniref:Lipoprotein n=2 Tax=Chloroherpeton thalassium TaxID=100716 RepID=B3QS61_CHLT3|nr:hypothetical protein Ctha_1547 [Chloroherpeton thalassium ATCC 35110]